MTDKKYYRYDNNIKIEMTDDEVVELKNQQSLWLAAEAARQAELDALAAARESAISKLSALGLSEVEIKALVGA